MRAAIASQWCKLTRRTVVLGTMGASVVFAILATAISITSATDTATSRVGPGPEQITKAALQDASGLVHGIEQATQFLGIVALVLFAFAIASEYSYGTLRNLLVRQPNRLVLLAGSLLGLWGFVALAAVAATLASVAVALLLAPGSGIDTAAWLSGDGALEIVKAMANTSLAMIGFGMVGAALGIVLRSPVAAIGVGLAYLLPIEGILGGAIDGSDGWLPGKLFNAVAAGGTDTVAYDQALALALLYGVVAAVVAAELFSRRDVAS
jgi:ABC-type transport system involved in multi-copper enzyme maturation permease subunit